MSRELDKLRKRTENSLNKAPEVLQDRTVIDNYLYQVQQEYHRVTELSKNAVQVIDDLDRQFEEKTKLRGHDIAFLMLAVALQCARQYLLTGFQERLTDKEASKKIKEKYNLSAEHSDRTHRYYNPSLPEIKTNPVPFDANVGSNGALKDGGSLRHRSTVLGHDPILGLIFGTANIATSTLTRGDFQSYHIYSADRLHGGKIDAFRNHADTGLVISHTIDKLLNQGEEGKKKVGYSLLKEIVHLESDVNTKHSLPLPIVSIYDPKLASSLAGYGLDMANVITVGKQATVATLINSIIAMIHKLFYNEVKDGSEKEYEVRTRKILSYSNAIAVSSNVVVTAFTKDLKKLDIGGILVALHRFISDAKFIEEVKRDFLKNEIYNKIVGSPYDFMEE